MTTEIDEKEKNLSKLKRILKELSSSYIEGEKNNESAKSDNLRLVITAPRIEIIALHREKQSTVWSRNRA